MLNLDPIKTQAVADQTTQAFSSFDCALSDAAMLTANFLTAAQGSGMTASETQRIIQRIHEGAAKLIEGRSEMVRATALLTRCLQSSQIEPTAVGCPWGMDAPAPVEAPKHLTLVA
ncbi:MAG: hypothetical protein ABW039_06780 [Sphingobium sp.]